MASNRAVGRNVHLYDATNRTNAFGGLLLTAGITNKNFYQMVGILLILKTSFILQDESGTEVEMNDDPLQPGNYYVVGSFEISNERFLTRTISVNSGTRHESFRNAIRARDGRCVITGEIAVEAFRNMWSGFQAAHIFPLGQLDHWIEQDFSRWITIPSASGNSINSVQNGILLRNDIHALFDNYMISINPDDNYKIVHFGVDAKGIAGRYLDQRLLNCPERPVAELLRWHFRQAVFANMRGSGEPIFESDFPPGSDIMGEILEGPKAAERMEFELGTRLAFYSKSSAE